MGPRPARRATRLTLALTVAASLGFEAAEAHPARSFEACVTAGEGLSCREQYAVLPGIAVTFKATIRPPHSGHTARVWRRRPEVSDWKKVALVRVRDGGRMAWTWETSSDHADEDDAWRVRFISPDHGTSNVIRLFVSDGAE